MPSPISTKTVSNPDPPNYTQLKCIECVQKLYAKQHFEQLGLDFATTFRFDPFSKIFMEDVDICEIEFHTRNDTLVLLREQRLDVWLHSMYKFVSSNRFPGIALIQALLELILSINQKNEETMDETFRRIQTITLLFETIVDNFPPTWPLCSNAYKNLFYNPINLEVDFKKLRMNANDGLFPILMALLDDAFKEVDEGNKDDDGFDSMMNFQQFDKIESGKSSYMKLSRHEKIDRIFIVLNLLIKLCEIDLSLWIHRYPFQTRNFMTNPNTCPLIAQLLWKGKECGECNMIMRNIIKLFTVSVWIDFPDDKTDTLARLVNLMSVAVNLSENCENDNLITYPNIKRLTETFASELTKSIESFPYTIEFYINVIGKVRSPAVRMLITSRILGKFTRQFENVSLRKIVDSITNKSYLQHAEKMDDTATRSRSKDTYPTYLPQMNKKSSKNLPIDRDEYLTLVLHLFKSYLDIYRTHDLLAMLVSDNVADVDNSKQFMKLHEKAQIEKSNRHDLNQINQDAERLRAAARDLASSEKIPVTPLTQCQNVHLVASNFIRLQEDLEYLVKLKKMFDGNVEVGDKFKLWRAAILQYLCPDESV